MSVPILTPARQCFRTAYALLRATGCAAAARRNLIRNGRINDFGFLVAAERVMEARGS